jgi:response regulator RpfG family c-di-GMP phosphodiesterase
VPGNTESLLVVDDDAAILNALRLIFESAGYRVYAATDPHRALDQLRVQEFNVISADYMMPGMSGAEFLAQARLIQPDAIRLLLTAATDFSAAAEAVNRGEVYRIIAKPWSRVDLLNTVRQALDLYNLRRQNFVLQQLVQQQNEELRSINRNLERLVQERTSALLDGMIAALDYRDTETQWHSRRVSAFSRRIAEEMGVAGDALLAVEQGALLHDIGKIGVRDAILLKPGPLSPDEWTEMRLHPELGERLLRRVEFLREASFIVLQHQERWDGSGYPQGLKGDQIVVGARIFAIADTLDAITSDRPYRRAAPYEAARAEIQRCAGTQFDPAAVDAFSRIAPEEWTRIREEITRKAAEEEAAGFAPRPHIKKSPA